MHFLQKQVAVKLMRKRVDVVAVADTCALAAFQQTIASNIAPSSANSSSHYSLKMKNVRSWLSRIILGTSLRSCPWAESISVIRLTDR